MPAALLSVTPATRLPTSSTAGHLPARRLPQRTLRNEHLAGWFPDGFTASRLGSPSAHESCHAGHRCRFGCGPALVVRQMRRDSRLHCFQTQRLLQVVTSAALPIGTKALACWIIDY